jgi:hypothetical protein
MHRQQLDAGKAINMSTARKDLKESILVTNPLTILLVIVAIFFVLGGLGTMIAR